LASQIANDALNNNFTYSGDTKYSRITGNFITNFFSDLYTLRGIIFGFGLGVATIIGFVYCYFLRLPGILVIMIWGAVLSVQILLIVSAYLLYDLASTWDHNNNGSATQIQLLYIFSYIAMGVCILYFCLMIVLRKRINLAIFIVKEAARAMAAMPIILLTPVLQAVAVSCFLVFWVIYVLFLASSGSVTTEKGSYVTSSGQSVDYTYKTFTYEDNTRYAFLYMLFMWFWFSQFVIACGQLVVALAFSDWYFSRDKKDAGNTSVTWVSSG
jgi:hypothetical protein